MRQSNLVCTPLAAAGRWFGVILSDSSKPGPLSDEERYLLWTLGKTAALATLARVATTRRAPARASCRSASTSRATCTRA